MRIDRVDRLADGRPLLIDYKTGGGDRTGGASGPTIRSCRSMRYLQPTALIAVAYGRINAADCGFVAEAERAGVF